MEVEENKLFAPTRLMDSDQLRAFIAEHREGSFTLLDVRQPAEYEEFHIPGATLVPLPQLMESQQGLDPRKPTIVYCAAGGRSRVAAQLLAGQGFEETYSLDGGLYAWEGLEAVGPRELNLDLVRGDESAPEMIALAYLMEEGLRLFYETAAAKAVDQELSDLLGKLVKVEEIHKQRLLERYAELTEAGAAAAVSAGSVAATRMEGGFDLVDFMRQNEPFLESAEKVLELAIMIESQALDLYLRFADKSHHEPTRQVLFAIAQEEKGHLATLGNLLDERS
jgi:sulfur-carrier protein adenylyltransferase/sulfurtransferase